MSQEFASFNYTSNHRVPCPSYRPGRGITDKIKKIITNIRKPIDTALDKVIGIVVNAIKKLGGALFGKGGSNNANGENEPGDNEEELEDTEVGKVVRFNADDASHKIWINPAGSDTKVMVASVPMDAEERLARWSREVEDIEDTGKKAKAKSLISSANSELGITEPAAKKAKKEIDEAKNADTPQENQQATDADNIVESSEEKLSRYFKELFEIFEEDEDGGAKVSASVIHPSSIISYSNKEAKITESRSGNKIVGYKASTKEGQDTPDGVIVGKEGSDKKYIKKRREENDRDALKNMGSNPNNQKAEIVNGKNSDDYNEQKTGIATSEHYNKQTDLQTIKFNASHLIADWFNGSGYSSALNLIQTSEYYNKKIMGDQEKEIVRQLNTLQETLTSQNPTGKYITFNALIKAKWMEITDNVIADKIRALSQDALKAKTKEQKQKVAEKVDKDLGGNTNPKFCKSVSYTIYNVVLKDANGVVVANNGYQYSESIGEDVHLKEILKKL